MNRRTFIAGTAAATATPALASAPAPSPADEIAYHLEQARALLEAERGRAWDSKLLLDDGVIMLVEKLS